MIDRSFHAGEVLIGAALVALASSIAIVVLRLSVAQAPHTAEALPPRPRPALPHDVVTDRGDKRASVQRVAPPRLDPGALHRAWRATNLGPTLSCLADDDTVLAWGSRARMNALDAATGALRWQVKISRVGPPDAPVLDGDRVLVAGMSAPPRAYDVRTGEELWRTHLAGAYLPLLVDAQRYWIGGTDFAVLALSRSTGEVVLRFDPQHQALYAGVIEPYPTRHAAGVLHDVLWTFDDTGARSPAWEGRTTVRGGQNVQIDAQVADEEGRMYAMNALGDVVAFDHEGRTRWTVRGKDEGPACSALFFVDDAIARVCSRVEMFAIEDGARLGVVEGSHGPFVAAAAVEGALVALAKGGELVITPAHAESVRRIPVTSTAEDLCLAHERVYLVTSDGALEAWL